MNKIYYKCCPAFNKDCTKEGCYINGGPCFCTTNSLCAKKDQYGNPIIEEIVEDDQNDSELESKI